MFRFRRKSGHSEELNRSRREQLREFSVRLRFKFGDFGLLNRALTHSSFVNESGRKVEDNERLEYLGDSVLGLVVNEHLYSQFPDYPEGKLARIKSVVVSEQSLAQAALRIELGAFLRMGRGEMLSGGARRPSNLADALEAVIAAVYLEQGLKSARKFVLGVLQPQIEAGLHRSRDPKSQLQEHVQKTSRRTPRYEVVSQTGPEHSKQFTCRVLVGGKELAQGTGPSRRKAEREAAVRALEILKGAQ